MGFGEPSKVGASITIEETEVFSDISPVAWTDLDLSAVVGANYALVILKVNLQNTNTSVAFRKNGDTDEHFDSIGITTGIGAALFQPSDIGLHVIVVVLTDSGGIIEWKGEGLATTVDVIGFIK
ncbi:hypothetical protein ES705_15969 [subsurface metagenome]